MPIDRFKLSIAEADERLLVCLRGKLGFARNRI